MLTQKDYMDQIIQFWPKKSKYILVHQNNLNNFVLKIKYKLTTESQVTIISIQEFLHTKIYDSCIYIFVTDIHLNKKDSIFFQRKCNYMYSNKINYILFYSPNTKLNKLNKKILALTKNALCIDYKKLELHNTTLINSLNIGGKFKISDSDNNYIFFETTKRKFKSENCNSLIKEKVFQYPSGEIYIAPDLQTTNGRILIMFKEKKIEILIKNGEIISDKSSFKKIFRNKKIYLSEIGIGTNPNVPPLKGLSFVEKSNRTWHIGIGENRDLGGTIKENYHLDIIIFNTPKLERIS